MKVMSLEEFLDPLYVCLFCPSEGFDNTVLEELTDQSGIDPFAHSGIKNYIWENMAYSNELFRSLPNTWPNQYSQLPFDRKSCPQPDCPGVKSKKKPGRNHYLRHATKHIPDVGYFAVCRYCGEVSKRIDNFPRHLNSCNEKPAGVDISELIQATKDNIFIR